MRLSRRLPWALVAALLVVLLCHEWFGADIWYHLYLGGRIAHTLSPQPADNLMLRQGGFVNLYWLFQLAARGAFSAGGMAGVSLLLMGYWALAFAFWLRTTRLARQGALGAAAALLVVLICQTRYEQRPEILSFAFLAMQVHWLASLRPGASPTRWEIARFALVEAAWANVHGYFAFGPVLVGLRIACLAWDRVRIPSGLWALLGAATLASLATPFGYHGWEEVVRFGLVLRQMRSSIQEAIPTWAVPAQVWTVDLFWLGWLAMLVIAWTEGAARRADRFALALAAAGLVLGATAYRNIPLLVFLGGPLLGGLARRPAPAWASSRAAAAGVAALAAGFGAWAVSGGFYASMGMPQRFGIRECPSAYPIPFSRYLAANGFRGTILNTLQDGGYLEFHFPEARLYTDSRVTDVAPVRRYLEALHSPSRFHELQRECAFDGALLSLTESRTVIAALLREQAWRIAQADLHRVFLVNRMGTAGTEAVLEEPAYYRGQDLTLPENGVPAVLWIALLAGADDREGLLSALRQFSTAPRIPSTLLEIARAYGESRSDAPIIDLSNLLLSKSFPTRPISPSALHDLLGGRKH